MQPVKNSIIRPFAPGDAAAVHAVLEATYGERTTSAAAFDWWCFGCQDAVSGFMVAEVEGKLVGVQPMEVFRFKDADRTVTGGLLTGVAVHPEFRRQGIFSALVRGCEREAWRLGASFVTTMPNERSRPGFLKMGYTDLGRRRLLIRPMDMAAVAATAVPVAGLGWLASTVMAGIQAVVKRTPEIGEYRVREVRDLPPEIHVLEGRHAAQFPGLRIQRSPAWWHWRYLKSPERTYRMFEARTSSGEVAGLATSSGEIRDGLRVVYLMDVAVRLPAALGALVAAVIQAAGNDRAVAVVAVTSSSEMTRALSGVGFWAVPSWAPVKRFYTVVRFNPDQGHQVPPAWRRIGGWYQMLGDWDNL